MDSNRTQGSPSTRNAGYLTLKIEDQTETD